MKTNLMEVIRKLSSLGERQGKMADKSAQYIMSILKKEKLLFSLHFFNTYIPKTEKVWLKADGKNIKCEGCSFVGGKITGKDSIVSSLISSQPLIEKSNINFNPECNTISRSNFYFAPAVAINKKDLDLVVKAKKVEGLVRVRKTKVRSQHILIGNTKNPENIIFTHFDSIGPGAIDNASGVAVVLGAIISKPKSLDKNLYVFDGNEELSYDFPVYWGHGFRVFEKKYFKIMNNAKKIIVPDCLGYGKTFSITDPKIVKLAFPISNIERWKNKIQILGGDMETLMRVYHSGFDTVNGLNERDMWSAVQKLLNITK